MSNKIRFFDVNGNHYRATQLAREVKISPSSAYNRLIKWEKGLMSIEQLLHVGKLPLSGRGATAMNECTKTGKWVDLGVGPRKNISEIKVGTFERVNLEPTD